METFESRRAYYAKADDASKWALSLSTANTHLPVALPHAARPLAPSSSGVLGSRGFRMKKIEIMYSEFILHSRFIYTRKTLLCYSGMCPRKALPTPLDVRPFSKRTETWNHRSLTCVARWDRGDRWSVCLFVLLLLPHLLPANMCECGQKKGQGEKLKPQCRPGFGDKPPVLRYTRTEHGRNSNATDQKLRNELFRGLTFARLPRVAG